MKATQLLTAAAILALGIGIYQYRHLKELHLKVAALQNASGDSAEAGRDPRSPGRSAIAPAAAPADDQVAGIKDRIVHSLALMTAERGRASISPDDQKAFEAIPGMIRGLSVTAALELIESLKADPSVGPPVRGHEAELIMETYVQVNPAQAVILIQSLPDIAERDHYLESAFQAWSQTDPAAAIAWFEKETAAGSSFTTAKGEQSWMRTAQARVDPVKAVAGMVRYLHAQPTDGPLRELFFTDRMKSTSEKRGLLSALGAAAKKPEDAEIVAKLRNQVINDLTSSFRKPPFEEATGLIDSEFTLAEKLYFARHIAFDSELEQPGKWARWMAKIEAPLDDEHPLILMARTCGAKTTRSYDAWLEDLPEGNLRDMAIANFCFELSSHDPKHAADWAIRIPKGSIRQSVIQKVATDWKARDPDAAAAFLAAQAAGK